MSADDLNTDVEATLDELRARLRSESAAGGAARQSIDLTGAPSTFTSGVTTDVGSGFAPGFADRVMVRLERETRTPPLALGLQLVFRRFAPLAAAAVLVVGAFNMFGARAEQLSVTERLLGLPEVSIENALLSDDAFSTWDR